jgi:hypothetical protein
MFMGMCCVQRIIYLVGSNNAQVCSPFTIYNFAIIKQPLSNIEQMSALVTYPCWLPIQMSVAEIPTNPAKFCRIPPNSDESRHFLPYSAESRQIPPTLKRFAKLSLIKRERERVSFAHCKKIWSGNIFVAKFGLASGDSFFLKFGSKLGSMLWSQISAIFDNFRRKNRHE